MNILKKILIPIVIVLLIRIIFQLYFFTSLEHKAQDSLFRIRGKMPISGDIVIIAIDDVTFQELNRPWPYPREFHAKLIDNLMKAGAKQVIFDIEFTEYSNPISDAALAVSASQAKNVIFAGKYIVNPQNPLHQQVQTPIQPLIAEGLNWGIVNMPTDWDGYVREYTLFETMDKVNYYSLGVASLANLRMYQQDWQKGIHVNNGILSVSDYEIPIIKRKNTLINYFGPAMTFQHISYSKVIDDESVDLHGIDLDEYYELKDSGVFKDKIVLIGATIEELHDLFPTSFSSRFTAGVEIHANFIEMVRQGKFLKELNVGLYFLLFLVLAIVQFFLLTWLRPQWSVFITMMLILALLFTAYVVFVRMNILIRVVEMIIQFIILYIAALVVHYIKSQKDKKFIKNSFEKYLAPELVKELLKNPQKLKYGGSLQELTVLFSDVVSFTTYTEKHKTEETVYILKGYLTEMVKTIINNGGIIDKFVGDEIMALYGVPIYNDNHALQACKTALDMRECWKHLLVKWEAEGIESFDFGVGINTGQAVVGNLGSEQIFDYTAIGDTINLGARLEAKTRDYETRHKIIISEFTLEKVKDFVEVRYLDEVKVKGKDIAVKIYELLGLKE